jgi:4'-phosphopantetheinyl transferase
MDGASPTPWLTPPSWPALSEGEAHVWLAELDLPQDAVGALRFLLSGDELGRAERFHFRRDRDRYVVGRGVLRRMLGAYMNSDPAALRFDYGAHGKPHLVGESKPGGLRFNVSHSEGHALFCFARGVEVGVDLERVREGPASERLAERFFSAGEVRALRALPRNAQDEAFFDCWTRKEAYIKARGEGLSMPLDRFEVTLAPGEPAELLRTDGDPRERARWSMRGLRPAPSFVGAVVVGGTLRRLECWRWCEAATPHAPPDRVAPR